MDKLINLGKSIRIKGELTGNEDLTIEGRIDGKIILDGHALTIGANGHIKAEIRAKSVVVAGNLEGDIVATDKVEIASSGSVQGDISAPRVALADGCSFRGTVDMSRKTASKTAEQASQPAANKTPTAAKPEQPARNIANATR